MLAEKKWPDGFCDIGGKTFQWVWENRKVFVDFCLTDMECATGMFKEFQEFCKKKGEVSQKK